MNLPRLVTTVLLISAPWSPGVALAQDPVGPTVTFRLGSATVAPGETVSVPMTIQSNDNVGGFSASIDFDEELLEVTAIREVFRAEENWGFALLHADNSNATPGGEGVDEGFVVAAGAFSFPERVVLPVGEATEVLRIDFRARPRAEESDSPLRFVDGARTVQDNVETEWFNAGVINGRTVPTATIDGTLRIEGPFGEVPPPARHLNLRGVEGLALTIGEAGGRILIRVAPAGDVDGDGREDLLLRYGPPGRATPDDEDVVVLLHGEPGRVGPLDPFSRGVRSSRIRADLDARNRSRSLTLAGREDVNGDGLADFLITAGREVLLVLGDRRLPERFDAGDVGDTVAGSVLFDSDPREPEQAFGDVLALAPDMNGDGLAEVLIAETASLFDRTHLFVLLGSRDLPARVDLQEIGLSLEGFVIEILGPAGSRGIDGAVGLGDVDGDGLGDIGVLTNPRRNSDGDRIHVLFGSASTPEVVVLDDLPAGAGFVLEGYRELARGGDIDGDGHEDLIAFQIPNGLADGWAHIVHGRPRDAFPEVITFDSFRSESLGIEIRERRDVSGSGGLGTPTPSFTLTAGRDIDGDGRAEVLLSASRRHVVYGQMAVVKGGATFLISGSDDLPARISADGIADGLGVRIDGIDPSGETGVENFILDDFDGDGQSEILLTTRPQPCKGDPFLASLERKVWIVPVGVLTASDTPPHVEAVFPEEGPVEGGESVIIFGAGFGGEQRVRFGARRARVQQVIGDGILRVEAPAAEGPLTLPVTVVNARGESTGDASYTYLAVDDSVLSSEKDPGRFLTILHRSGSHDGRGAVAGDFNGDSRPDVAIVDYSQSGGRLEELHLHYVFGSGERSADVDLDDLTPPAGVTLTASPEEVGVPITGLRGGGDLNGDGFDDLVLSVFLRQLQRPREYRVILGREEFPTDVGLLDLPGTVRLTSPRDIDIAGRAAIVPDLDGDGFGDLLLSVRVDRDVELHVVRGGPDLPEEVVIDRLAEQGLGARFITDLRLTSAAGPAGDFNGDGHPDVFFAGPGRASEGAVLIVYGGPGMFAGRGEVLDPGFIGDQRGLLITGRSIFTGFDFFASVPGDVDGDGDPDLFLRQDNTFSCTLWPRSGEGFLLDHETVVRVGFDPDEFIIISEIYGDVGVGPPDFAISSGPPGSQEGVATFRSPRRGEVMGVSSAPAGDFNGDGFDDILVGTLGSRAYVFLGGEDVLAQPLVEIGKPGGRVVTLETSSRFTDGGFDWDGDGAGDVLLGTGRGRVDIVFGKPRVETKFIRGDSDRSGELGITDAIVTLGFLFLGSAQPSCLDALDADDSGSLLINDPIYLLQFLFLGGPRPPFPFPEPGFDATADDLRCLK